MGRLKLVIFGALIAGLPATAIAQTVKAPRGWQDHADGDVRVLEKGTSLIEIEGWTQLNGQTLEAYMKANEARVPEEAQFRSSKGVKAERIEGAYAATRSITRNGKTGTSILYGCSGAPGTGRLMMLTTDTSNFGDLISGGMFLKKVCKNEPKGQATQRASTRVPVATAPAVKTSEPKVATSRNAGSHDLAKENARIPKHNRPVAATTVMKSTLEGFPAMVIWKAKMMMTFPNGYSTYCADWDLLSQSPSPSSIGREVKNCDLTKDKQEKGSIRSFKPGQTINLALGKIGGYGYDLGGSTSSVIHGGDLVMTKDGRIAIGSFGGFSVSSGGNGAGGSRPSKKVSGRYYLNGYTITIETDQGDILHSFFGANIDKDSGEYSSAYLGGTYYWKRD